MGLPCDTGSRLHGRASNEQGSWDQLGVSCRFCCDFQVVLFVTGNLSRFPHHINYKWLLRCAALRSAVQDSQMLTWDFRVRKCDMFISSVHTRKKETIPSADVTTAKSRIVPEDLDKEMSSRKFRKIHWNSVYGKIRLSRKSSQKSSNQNIRCCDCQLMDMSGLVH